MDIPHVIDLTQPEVVDLTCSESPIQSSSYDYHTSSHSYPIDLDADSDLDDILYTETPLDWFPSTPPSKTSSVSVSVSVNTSFCSPPSVCFNHENPHPYCAQQWEYIEAAQTHLVNYFYTYASNTTPITALPASTQQKGVKRKLFCE